MAESTSADGPDPSPGDHDSGVGDREPLFATPADDRARIDGLEDRVRGLEELAGSQPPPSGSLAEPTRAGLFTGTAAAPPVYPTLADFVRESFAPIYSRARHGGRWRWCPQWWDHGEAVSRLQALWLAWEALHAQGGTSFGEWYRNHLDHQLPILMGPDGPFRDCVDQHWPPDEADKLVVGTPPADNIVWQAA